jgi:hypothetical protein
MGENSLNVIIILQYQLFYMNQKANFWQKVWKAEQNCAFWEQCLDTEIMTLIQCKYMKGIALQLGLKSHFNPPACTDVELSVGSILWHETKKW